MVSQAGDDGPMKGGVGLAVATAIDATATARHTGGGRDGTRPTQLGEGRFRPKAIGVVPKDDEHLGGRVSANAEPVPRIPCHAAMGSCTSRRQRDKEFETDTEPVKVLQMESHLFACPVSCGAFSQRVIALETSRRRPTTEPTAIEAFMA